MFIVAVFLTALNDTSLGFKHEMKEKSLYNSTDKRAERTYNLRDMKQTLVNRQMS